MGTSTGTDAVSRAEGEASEAAEAGAEALDTERLAEGLRVQTGRFIDAVHGVDPDAMVPSCPDWPLRVLVAHVGQAQRFAAEIVRTGQPVPAPDPRDADPGDPDDWPGRLRGGAAELADAVREADAAGVKVWTFLGPGPAVFWLRRGLYETSVHYADALLTAAGGSYPTGFEIDADLAADGVSEVLELISSPGAATFKPSLAELRGQGETLQLRPEEPSVAGWRITRTPGGVSGERGGGTAGADVTMAAPVADLMLAFARRLPVDDPRLTVTGDRALLHHWLDHTAL